VSNKNSTKTVSFKFVQYAVVYKVNGVEYWDNNYGKYYSAVKK
jgi:hypothetical protein